METAEKSKYSLQDAHVFVAGLVAEGYSEFLPIFERLEVEIARVTNQQNLLDKARKIAAQKNAMRDSQSAF